MSKNDWYFLGFALTVLAACFMWWLAFTVWRRDKRAFLNRMYALAIVCMGFWVISGFAEKIMDTPNEVFTLWTYRWAYFTSTLGILFFLLFLTAFYLDRTPGLKIVLPLLVPGLAASLLALTPLVIKSASHVEGTLVVVNGPLWRLAALMLALGGIASITLLARKWNMSRGIDRARASVMLFGTVLFIPPAFFFVMLMPAVTGNEVFANYAFLAAAVPVGFTGYAVIRLRVLDTRVILRRSGVFVIASALLSLPLIGLLLLSEAFELNRWVIWVVVITAFCILVNLAPSLWRYIEHFSSRFFFAGLYDELQLLDAVSSRLSASSDMRRGLFDAMRMIVPALGLRELELLLLQEATGGARRLLRCRLNDDLSLEESEVEEATHLAWVNNLDSTVITEELRRWPHLPEDLRIGDELLSMHLAACVPVSAVSRRVACLLMGEKVSERALSSTDISFLEKVAERMGLYIDNYALSAELALQLAELEGVYEKLRYADRFKSEIIQVASHEFRTPVTIVSGFAQTMYANWGKLTDEQKVTFMGNIVSACQRLTRLTDQFFTLSRYREGESTVNRMPVRVRRILDDLVASLNPEDRLQVSLEVERNELVITDPEHLQTILRNVVDNAIRFSPSDKPVTIRAWSDSMNMFIRVQDSGKGMPSKEAERIFEPFVQLEDVRYHSQGMGLGLHIVRVLSTLLGVDIEIESTPGSGTSVTLTLSLR